MDDIANPPYDHCHHQHGQYLDGEADDAVKFLEERILMLLGEIVTRFFQMLFFVLHGIASCMGLPTGYHLC